MIDAHFILPSLQWLPDLEFISKAVLRPAIRCVFCLGRRGPPKDAKIGGFWILDARPGAKKKEHNRQRTENNTQKQKTIRKH